MDTPASVVTDERRRGVRASWHPPWHWLLLLMPATAAILLHLAFCHVAATFFPDVPAGARSGLRGGVATDAAGQYYVILQPLLFVFLSIGLGGWWRWKESDGGERIAFGFFIGLMIFIVNASLLFAAVWRAIG